MKNLLIIVSAAIAFNSVASALQAARPELSQIAKRWSGLDKSTVPKQLSRIVLTIEAAAPPSGPQERTVDEMFARRQADRAAPKASQPTAPTSQPIEGTFVSTVIPFDEHGEANTRTEMVAGEYFTEIGVLRFRRLAQGVPQGPDMLAVFDEDATAVAIIYTGRGASWPPFILYQGDEMPSSLFALADLDPLSSKARSPGRGAAPQQPPQQPSQQNQARAEYQEKRKELQEQISAAIRARDQELTAKLRQQRKDLDREYAARRTGARTQTPSSSTSGAGGTTSARCPATILAWANEMDRNGASVAQFQGFIELSNLFRPSVFSPHFGKSFAELSEAELQELVTALQGPCAKDGSAFAKGGVRNPLQSVLSGRPGYSVTEAGIAGLALELISTWYSRTIDTSFDGGNLQTVATLEREGAHFVRLMWPAERDAARTELANGRQELIAQSISEQLESIAARIRSGESAAINDLYSLSIGGLFEQLDESHLEVMKSRYFEVVDSAIDDYLAAFRNRSNGISDPKEKLTLGQKWYEQSYAGLSRFADHSPFPSFLKWFGADREEAYRTLKPILLAEIERIGSRPAAVSYGYDFRLPLDAEYSPTWREIEQRRKKRLEEIEYAELVERVGDGPFEPEYPGAILLNAIYRNDLAQIAEEDGRFHKAFINQMDRVGNTGAFQMADLLTGGSGAGGQTRNAIARGIRDSSMINPLMGFFAVSYEYVYPNCMDTEPVVFKKTTEFETVVRNGFGTEINRYSSGVQTQTYNINRRHAEAFRKLRGDTSNPEGLGVFTKLWGFAIPEDLKESIQFLNDSMRGLRQAMQDNACDSDLMKRLDANMVSIFAVKNP